MKSTLPPESNVERLNVQRSTFLEAVAAHFGGRPRQNELLAGHTTLRLGGPAEIWLAVESVSELVTAVTLARQYDVPVFMLGGGANLLIRDTGIRGLVIENRANKVEIPSSPFKVGEGGKVKIVAESGAVLPNLARRCARHGLSGLEWAVGVPGTIGGAVVNNAGAYGSDMAHNLSRAELLTPTGERLWQPVEWFEYGYRTSRLKKSSEVSSQKSVISSQSSEVSSQKSEDPGLRSPVSGREQGWIVLQAELHLTAAPVAEIKARMDEFNRRRKASQPPGATIGSMFKNPPGDYAGRLIEAAGLKGYKIGQAQISPIHANFFQNLGGATATEVLSLIEIAQTTVESKFGVKLELEIEVVGEEGRN
ncbi:MAG: UDP-N-acetylmuramate dehydrogenase [Anaerolineales bacterium]|nr:UDP-N-acetylmuramate dehydrogenase [Anaerolineales bacterium]